MNIMTIIKERGLIETCALGFWYAGIRLKSLLFVGLYKIRNYDIHHTVIFYGSHEFRRVKKNTIKIGEHCGIGNNVVMRCFGKGKILVGKNVSINEYTIIHAGEAVVIGDNVTFGANCYINDTNHSFTRIDIPINRQGWTAKKIIIEDDVWLGANVTILDGVRLGKGCVIGAGAVVTKDVEAYAIAVGIPAKKNSSRKVVHP